VARKSVTKAHKKIQELFGKPTFVEKDPKSKTNYVLNKGSPEGPDEADHAILLHHAKGEGPPGI